MTLSHDKLSIAAIKRRARKISRARGIRYTQALDLAAQDGGYIRYQHALNDRARTARSKPAGEERVRPGLSLVDLASLAFEPDAAWLTERDEYRERHVEAVLDRVNATPLMFMGYANRRRFDEAFTGYFVLDFDVLADARIKAAADSIWDQIRPYAAELESCVVTAYEAAISSKVRDAADLDRRVSELMGVEAPWSRYDVADERPPRSKAELATIQALEEARRYEAGISSLASATSVFDELTKEAVRSRVHLVEVLGVDGLSAHLTAEMRRYDDLSQNVLTALVA